MTTVYNFSAGPAVLPEAVLQTARQEMLDYQGTGVSVMAMSHRSDTFQSILYHAEQDLPPTIKPCFCRAGRVRSFRRPR